jgi:replicative DNA helicase
MGKTSLALSMALTMAHASRGQRCTSRCCARVPDDCARQGLAAIVVDYIQLLMPATRSRANASPQNRNEELSSICRALKTTAKELQVPILALSPLNRAVETRADKHPTLSDLSDSGSIEQEADLVALLYRQGYYSGDPHDESAELHVAKQRNGPTGMVPLRFCAPYARYERA